MYTYLCLILTIITNDKKNSKFYHLYDNITFTDQLFLIFPILLPSTQTFINIFISEVKCCKFLIYTS